MKMECVPDVAFLSKKYVNWEERWEWLNRINRWHIVQIVITILLFQLAAVKIVNYQTHVAVKELGLKPLLVTYHGNNYLPEGEYTNRM